MDTTANLPVIDNIGDDLRKYIRRVMNFPMLSQEKEIELATRFRNENDLNAAHELVTSHLRIVVSVSRDYDGYGLPRADLIQEGNVGLMKAVKRYDPDRGVRLAAYALHYIRAEINEFIVKNWRLVRIATTKAQRKLFFNLRSMKNGAASLTPSQITNIAQRLDVSEKDVTSMETRFAGGMVALDPEDNNDEVSHSPIYYLADDENYEPQKLIENAQQEQLQTSGLQYALSKLDSRSLRIIESRHLCEGTPVTLHELAAEFNVSHERIRQIETAALKKLRGYIEERGID